VPAEWERRATTTPLAAEAAAGEAH